MKILLVNPPSPFLLDDRVFLTLGILQVATVLEEAGHDVKVEDLGGQDNYVEITGKRASEGWDCYGVTATTPQFPAAVAILNAIRGHDPGKRVIIGGPHATVMPESCEMFDCIVQGDGEEAILDAIQVDAPKRLDRASTTTKGTLKWHWPARHLVDMKSYDYKLFGRKGTNILTEMGCPFNCCLTGDTLVNTVEGDIPIKDLVGRDHVGVYTYDPKTGRAFISDAINIHLAKKNAPIVRVAFSDGTHIDCTPDHRFLTFKVGNQFVPERERVVEAAQLTRGMRVRALRFRLNPFNGYVTVEWKRRGRRLQHRMIYEYLSGESLDRNTHVHHKNEVRDDNKENNLERVSPKEHAKRHYERMAAWARSLGKSLPREHFVALGKLQRGKVRSLENRQRYRDSKLGEKNPNWKGGRWAGKSRLKEVNHRVVSVMPMGNQDVYDLEVPSTHWFYANNVLVHNSFCCGRGSKYFRLVRYRLVDDIIRELRFLQDTYGIDSAMDFSDEINLQNEPLLEFCEKLIPLNMKFRAFIKANLFNDRQAEAMAKAGFVELCTGVESGSNRILGVIDKQTTRESNKRFVDLCHKHGIKAKAFMSLAQAGETHESAMESKDWLTWARPDDFDVTIVTVYPGTPYWDKRERVGLNESGQPICRYTKQSKNQDENGATLFFEEVNYAGEWAYYKGVPGRYVSHVWTPDLSKDDLVLLRDQIEADVRKELAIPYPKRYSGDNYEHSFGMGITPQDSRVALKEST